MPWNLDLWIALGVLSEGKAATFAPRPADSVPGALFGANIGYWSEVNGPALTAVAQEAGLTVCRYQPGTYNDPHTVPGPINPWDFTAVDEFGAQRLADFGRLLIATGSTRQACESGVGF